MRIERTWCVALALSMSAPGMLRAQTATPADTSLGAQAYEARRAELVKELQGTQDQLSQLRGERVQLEARIDNALALSSQRRARELLMSNEQDALLKLDAVLNSAQESMLAQRDRMRSLGDAVRRRTGSVLIVLLRADSGQTLSLGAAELKVDDGTALQRSYSATAAGALQQGAVDMLFRSEVLPTTHMVKLQLALGGQPVTQTVNVDAKGETVTYVQFAIRGGQLVPSSWTSQGTTPF